MKKDLLKTTFMIHQEQIFRDMQLEYKNSSLEEKQKFEDFCKKSIIDKISYENFCNYSTNIPSNLRWYILGKSCADLILDNHLSIIDFLKWFRNFSHTDASLAYTEYIKERLADKNNLKQYYSFMKNLPQYINDTMSDYVFEREKERFKNNLEKWDNNTNILQVFDERARIYDRYSSGSSLYFILYPLLSVNTKKVAQVLSQINNIYSLEDFLHINAVSTDIDILCSLLKYSPVIINEENNWNKKILPPLLTIVLNEYLIDIYEYLKKEDYKEENIEDELKINIEKFLYNLQDRLDKDFFLQKWLLHLTSNIEKGHETQQKITSLIIETIAGKTDPNFKNNFLENAEEPKDYKNLLLALIYISDGFEFPPQYITILENYLTNQENSISVFPNNKGSFLTKEHYLLSQLFLKINEAEEKWRNIWQRLYTERRNALYSRHQSRHYEIHRSQYLILIGVGAVEYFLTDNKDSALKLITIIWNALMEIYLSMPRFLYNDFLNSVINRLIIIKSFAGGNIKTEIEMIKDNPKLVSNIMVNLRGNNLDIKFAQGDEKLIDNLKYYIEIEKPRNSINKRTDHQDDYIAEIENIIKELST